MWSNWALNIMRDTKFLTLAECLRVALKHLTYLQAKNRLESRGIQFCFIKIAIAKFMAVK